MVTEPFYAGSYVCDGGYRIPRGIKKLSNKLKQMNQQEVDDFVTKRLALKAAIAEARTLLRVFPASASLTNAFPSQRMLRISAIGLMRNTLQRMETIMKTNRNASVKSKNVLSRWVGHRKGTQLHLFTYICVV